MTRGAGAERSEPARLDAALVERGLAVSRSRAVRVIEEGLVSVDGRTVTKPSLRVSGSARIEVEGTHAWVSRAALKLNAGLEASGVDPRGRFALDVGASTGGFTQVLLERGAAGVIALDVGHGQLVQQLRDDERVVVVEGANARELTAESLAGFASWAPSVDLVVADVSFISLTLVLPALVRSVDTEADFVLLIKPQFEVGKGGTREGIVRDSAARHDAVMGVLWAAWDAGLPTAGVYSSPIAGSAGNHEYLAWFSSRVGRNPSEWLEHVAKEVT
ncbi:MAG TPA: TlyA family RNA methyltransferase [Terrimesophilobacter sp.]|nr:TlyA family RNA methyltransferase [Terrimesophilobacter sp.]